MKAIAVFPKKKSAELIDHPTPAIESPSQVKLKMSAVGVCGTDKEILSFKYGTPPAGSDYLVIGHESLGQVVETGAGVKNFKKGDWVVTTVRRPCSVPSCKACRCGRPDFCLTGKFHERGINGIHGFMTEFVVDDEMYMNRLPEGLEKIGVLVEPLTIAEKALTEVWQIQRRMPWMAQEEVERRAMSAFKAVVLGAGPVGLLGAMLLRYQGFRTFVYSIEPEDDEKAKITAMIGAKYLCAKKHPIEDLVAETGNIDIIYEATGASKLSFDFMPHLGTNGVFVFTGIPGLRAEVEIDADTIMRHMVLKNQVIFGTVNAGHQAFANAVRDLGRFQAAWPDAVARLITRRCPPENFGEIVRPGVGGIKNIVEFSALK